jgi:DeoR/GlpR family transcriptional regulator of sugar metabolism
MELNNPDVRLDILQSRLAGGAPLVAHELAAEFDISADTVRRDLIALENLGAARRVRGGAVPMARPAPALRDRSGVDLAIAGRLAHRALGRLRGASTLLLDGGTTCLALARALRPMPGLVVVTASPFIAAETHRRGIGTEILPGRVSEQGGIACGVDCEAMLLDLAADAAVLGACGLDADFGLSSDDILETAVKRRMALSAAQVVVLADRTKLGRRARHRTLSPGEIDVIVTDGDRAMTRSFAASGIEVEHA